MLIEILDTHKTNTLPALLHITVFLVKLVSWSQETFGRQESSWKAYELLPDGLPSLARQIGPQAGPQMIVL